jgi:hypothetical protein
MAAPVIGADVPGAAEIKDAAEAAGVPSEPAPERPEIPPESVDLSILEKILLSITEDPPWGPAPLKVQFDVDVLTDDVEKPKFMWSFGDGGTSTKKNPVHVFKKPGLYKVTLRVEDAQGRAGNDETTIHAEEE